ncbi:hypothetical protein EIN_166100 [Entamoeba invadens IP1]|uniref:Condensation domain-containing protein n=1 Tax=Entamoeba invadens IP1 TaxID=370355 RepID=A0A0A1UBK2_ENTIV|nr:hypothetical protein EIN_166100 [Entamoeba invadens IP1]ELP92605.1 hypothetical protein EIN_166100 [Entamoeba invadens IP1]|eukprot:XP_004259376.1 hypothetical protein EIN_166100 [Entamoeba invadens IP1]
MSTIRPLNGYEFAVSFVCLSLSDTFPKLEFGPFKKAVLKELIKYTVFHLDIVYKDHHAYWSKFSDTWLLENSSLFITEVPFEEPKDVETASYNLHKEGTPLFTIEFSSNDELTQIKLLANHVLCDGRTLFTLFQIIKNAIPNERHEEIADQDLFPFDYTTLYDIDKTVLMHDPKSWDIPKKPLIPQIPEKSQYINIYHTFNTQKVLSYCKRHQVGVQAILMTVQQRAMRKFNQLPDNSPISVYCPSDTRRNKYAKDELKRSKFYCMAGANFPVIFGKEKLEEEIVECNGKMREMMETNECCVQLLIGSMMIDSKTLAFAPNPNTPNLCQAQAIMVSNIGRYVGLNQPRVKVMAPCDVNGFSAVLYSWHSEKSLYTMFFVPDKMDAKLLEIMNKELSDVMEYVCKDE